MAPGGDGPVDDRRRRGGARLRERGGARTDRLSRSLIPAQVLEEAGPVRAAFTTRRGGVSRGAYRSLNLAYRGGDAARAVAANRRRLAAALGIAPGACVEAEQVQRW
ncbi:MAG: hypothetical protein E6H04_13845 [Bacillati bacterium ANGP1]|uniref:Laccase domain-containing protein n=1 Tax=Candidatus Segetimicrobium genomatis TaxID=2569760 RepID=A0A537J3K9_9BACT|nr:MAG: hypothetical protein E6H04_13845 [Terrabacteria group bacterium ANGP1]